MSICSGRGSRLVQDPRAEDRDPGVERDGAGEGGPRGRGYKYTYS